MDPNTRPKREFKGMKKCGKCFTCDYVHEGKEVKATHTNAVAVINAAVAKYRGVDMGKIRPVRYVSM